MLARNLSRQSELNRHQKSRSAHYRPSAKTEASSWAGRPVSILSRLGKRPKQARLTINELMKSKFSACRAY